MKIIKSLAVKSLSSSSNPTNYLLWLSPYVCLTIPCGFIQPNNPTLSIVLDVAIVKKGHSWCARHEAVAGIG